MTMLRCPIQVLVLPYFRASDNGIRYAVLERSDTGQWQAVAGGVENGESVQEAAARELHEEIGIPIDPRRLVPLDSQATIPAARFPAWSRWRETNPAIWVVPEYCFGAEIGDPDTVRLSREHVALEWLAFDDALLRLSWDSNRNALWELNERVARG